MNADEYFVQLFEERRKAWEAGGLQALLLTILDCEANGRPLPPWAVEAVYEYVQWGFVLRRSGAHGSPSPLKKYRAAYRDWRRWMAAENELFSRTATRKRGKVTRADAFERARAELAGSPWRGSARAIERSHAKVQQMKKKGRGGIFDVFEGKGFIQGDSPKS